MGRSIKPIAAGVVLAVLLLCARAVAQSATGSLRGTVTDPSGAAVVGVIVNAAPAGGQAHTAVTNARGAYEIPGLASGPYDVTVAAPGFQQFDKPGVTIAAGQTESLDIPLVIQVEKEQVQVSDTAPTLEVSPDKNASAVSIKGSDLDSLSDDPDQLQQDLQALAGPATGPNGGQIYVNGFTAGQLPPKSSIREIRVNQNPFSAEYDSVGFGRIEILTKPGTNQLHGSAFLWANDQPFNSWNPFVAVNDRPGYYTVLWEGDLSGSLNKKTSFSASVFQRDINQLELGALLVPATSTTLPVVTQGAMGVPNPRHLITGLGSIDYQLSTNNTLTVFYQYRSNNENNDGISTTSLPGQAYNSTSSEHQLQFTDTQIFHDTIVNETRFQYLRDYAANNPVSTGFAFSAPGYVTGGGNSSGRTVDRQNHYEFQNYTTIVKGKNNVKFGARLRDASDWNSSLATANGSFTFASSQAYQAAEQALAAAQPVPAADYPGFSLGVGSAVADVNLFDAGIFVQDDWQCKPNITLSGGFRFETQTGIPDDADYAPRAAIAYGVGKTKAGAPRVVFRGGWGIFYNRFPLSNLLNTDRFNGTNQILYSLDNVDFFPNVPSPSQLTGFASQPTVDSMARSFRAPYTMQTAATMEEQIAPGTTLTVNYINARGVHQLYTANINTPLPGTFDPNNPQAATYPFGYDAGYIDQYISEGIFKQNEMIVNFNGKAGKYLSLYGYYLLNFADGTTNGLLSDYYNPALDYGRANFDVRDRVFIGGSVNFPYGFEMSPYIVYISGQPFNITTGEDLFGASLTNQNARPSFTTLPLSAANVYPSPWGNLYDGLPAAGESVVPINLGTGPSQFYINLGISKTFNFGPKPETKPAAADSADASSSSSTPAKPVGRYSFAISAYARNVLNQVSLSTPVGVVGAPYPASPFLHSYGLAINSPANRQIYLYIRFGF
jgi:Carboxypeptidase regulatory-like domain